MFALIKRLLRLGAEYDADNKRLHDRIKQLELTLAERTEINVDVSYRGASHVIMVGRYKNRDYVQTFTIDTDEMSDLIARLKTMEKYGTVKRVDAPPVFKAVMKRDFWDIYE